MNPCGVNGCLKEKKKKSNFCSMHVARMARNKSFELKTKEEVLLSRIVKTTDDCWLYTSYINELGYGRLRFEGKKYLAHRLSYILKYGPIKDDDLILHKCNRPACINPDHLKKGTHLENQEDRKTSLLLNTENNEMALRVAELEKEKVILKKAIDELLEGVKYVVDNQYTHNMNARKLKQARVTAIALLTGGKVKKK